VRNFLWRRHDAVPVSALSGEGLDTLRMAIRNEIVRTAPEYKFEVPFSEGKAIHFLMTRGAVLRSDVSEDSQSMSILVKMPEHIIEHFVRKFPNIEYV